MNGRTILAIVLIAIGIISLGYQGFTYTTKKKVIDVGPIEASKSEHHTVSLPPIVGVLALVGGIVILISGSRTSSS